MVRPVTAIDAIDGRSARSARTRRAVVDALLALIDEGNLRPTARMIAERAGVSQRSVYVHFDDLEDLFAEASKVRIGQILEALAPVDPALPLETRIVDFAAAASRTLEGTLAVRRAATLHEPFSPVLAQTLAGARRAGRQGLERTFADELDTLGPEPRKRALAALTVAVSSHTWESLRLHARFSVEESRAVITDLLEAVLDKISV